MKAKRLLITLKINFDELKVLFPNVSVVRQTCLVNTLCVKLDSDFFLTTKYSKTVIILTKRVFFLLVVVNVTGLSRSRTLLFTFP